MSAASIAFWFDLSSPYAHFAGLEIDALAACHGRTVHWKLSCWGDLQDHWKFTAHAHRSPLTAQPLEGDQARHDWARQARLATVPFVLREDFPLVTHLAARMVLAAEAEKGVVAAGRIPGVCSTRSSQRAPISRMQAWLPHWAPPRVSSPPRLSLPRAVQSGGRRSKPVARRRWNAEFAYLPGFLIDGEPFWGADRLALTDGWLTRAGW